ncbi:MAG: SDR family NAD(P)-dependent oxidoreductase [Bauldia sp.]
MRESQRGLAVVTGASSGIGRELARICADSGYDLIIAADEPEIGRVADQLEDTERRVLWRQVDLATADGVDELLEVVAAAGKPVDVLCANAGHGLGQAFLDQDFTQIRHVIDTNITGTVYLLHKLGQEMRTRRQGRILITGSIAGFIPGSFQAVNNGTKAFIDSFAAAIRNELKGSGVTVTCLMPGATETRFFERAGMLDTKVGRSKKDDPATVAQAGFDAMMKGQGDIVVGWKNVLESALANVTPAAILAERHRGMAKPGSGDGDQGYSK